MKVSIKHVEKKKGLVFSKTLYGVTCSVTFGEEEKAIIEERKLHKDIIMERDWSADIDAEKKESRGLGSKLATAAFSGTDANHPHLTINKLMRGEDVYFVTTPAEAKNYEAALKEALKGCKGWLEDNAETGSGNEFEL